MLLPVLLLWIFLSICFIRDKPRSVEQYLKGIGSHIPGLRGRKFHESIGILLICLLIGTSIAVLLPEGAGTSSEDLQDLSRPEYGEGNRKAVYYVTASSGDRTVRKKITIEIPDKEADPVLMDEQIQEAIRELKKLEERTWELDPELPSRYQGVEIVYHSMDPDLITDIGTVSWDRITEETSVGLRAELCISDRTTTCDLILKLAPGAESFDQQVDQTLKVVQNGEMIDEQMVVLPETDAHGIHYQWEPAELKEDNTFIYLFLLVVFPGIGMIGWRLEQRKRQKDYERAILKRYPDLLNKLLILMSAGMSLQKALVHVGDDYEGQKQRTSNEEPLYEAVSEISGKLTYGYSLNDCLSELADTTGVHEMRQLCSMLQSGWKRGDDHILLHLSELHERSWEMRKREIKKMSEEADTRLLAPLMLMLVVILMIVVTPAVLTMKF